MPGPGERGYAVLDRFIYDLVTLAVIIDPVGTAAIFAALGRHTPPAARRAMAVRGTLIAAGICVAFAFGGEALLRALGVSLAAFQAAGGALLFLLATDMVFAHESGLRQPTRVEADEAQRSVDISVFPLAIPLIAGPGALTSLVLLMRQADGAIAAQALVLSALAVVIGLTGAALLGAGRLLRLLGVTGAQVVSRVLGVVLAALAAELLLSGIRLGLLNTSLFPLKLSSSYQAMAGRRCWGKRTSSHPAIAMFSRFQPKPLRNAARSERVASNMMPDIQPPIAMPAKVAESTSPTRVPASAAG
jgi:multiple antibiotic resistance protein